MFKLPIIRKEKRLNKIGVLTSGGDAPGMNAAIRAVVRFGITEGAKVVGINRGYTGLIEGDFQELELRSVANLIQKGGTFLKTSRCEEFKDPKIRLKAAKIMQDAGLEGLVVIGGDGSFTGAHLLENETGFKVIGVPGTIDNDIWGTEETIGFDTAVNTALDAIDRIRDTASSHDRTFLVEVMGRNSGFIAMRVGVGGGAETIVIPEDNTSIKGIAESIESGLSRGKTSSIIVVAEGPNPGISYEISKELGTRGHSSRVCVLGHTQRGGKPSSHDRLLASILGASAVSYLFHGDSNSMVGMQNGSVVLSPFSEILGKKKKLETDWLALARILAN